MADHELAESAALLERGAMLQDEEAKSREHEHNSRSYHAL